MGVWKPKTSPFYYWECQINGERYSGSTKQTNKRKAEEHFHREKRRILDEIKNGPQKNIKRLTLKEASNLYYNEKAQFRADAPDILNYLITLRDQLGDNTYLDTIKLPDLSAAQARLRGIKNRYGRLPANRSVNIVIPETIRSLWRWCEDVQDLDLGKEPKWAKITLPTPDERVRELTKDEDERLFRNLRQDYHPLMRFAMISGLRMSNLIGLSWQEVDLDARTITVKVKSRKPGGKVIKIPVTDHMRAILSQCKGHHPYYVFTYICMRANKGKKKGKRYPYKKSTFRRPFKRAMKEAGIEDFRFHDYRHTAATRTLRASNNLKAVQKLLGHEDITTTAKYAHVLFDDVREAMDAVESQNNPKKSVSEESEDDLSALKNKRNSK